MAKQTANRTPGVAQTILMSLIAGLVYGMFVMVVEAIIGHGLWSPLRYIAAVFTLGKDTNPSFSLTPVFVGLMGHMMNAIIFGLIFAYLIVRYLTNTTVLIIGSMVYGAIIFLLMWFLVLPPLDPAMLLVNPVGFLIGHLMYGLVLGIGLAVIRQPRVGGLTFRPANA